MNIELTKEQTEAFERGESITLEPKRKKWQPQGGMWNTIPNRGLDPYTELRDFGAYYHTVEQADKAYHAMRTHNRLLSYVAEFGGDWEADWEDTDQEKWYVYYDHQNEMWEFNMGYTHQDLGNVYMPYDCARGLTRKLHRGEVEL